LLGLLFQTVCLKSDPFLVAKLHISIQSFVVHLHSACHASEIHRDFIAGSVLMSQISIVSESPIWTINSFQETNGYSYYSELMNTILDQTFSKLFVLKFCSVLHATPAEKFIHDKLKKSQY